MSVGDFIYGSRNKKGFMNGLSLAEKGSVFEIVR